MTLSMAPKQLPGGWRWTELEEVCRVVSGATPPTGVPEYWDGDIVWVTPTDLGQLEETRICTSARRITKAGYDNCNVGMIPPGSVVLSSRAPIGHLGIADVPLCTNQGCKSLVPGPEVDSEFLFYALTRAVPALKVLGSGATFAEVSKSQVEHFRIGLPGLAEQRRIVAILKAQMAEVEKARAAADDRLKSARALPAAYLRVIFNGAQAKAWPRKRLDTVATLLPSKSIATAGDTEIRAITTACLSEAGFRSSGVKSARMWAGDAAQSLVRAGEVLVARSNTAELVGRVSMFEGEPEGVVASDLTIRLWASENLLPRFLTAYLSFLYLTGYWQDNAGGASGSMKKITRTQIAGLSIPVPPKHEQQCIAKELDRRAAEARDLSKALDAEVVAIRRLPTALLRQAFAGKL